MPLGKVFNAAEQQVQFSPVTNYYQGKAIRAGLAAQEQDAELKDLQIQSAKYQLSPEAMRAAGEEAKLKVAKLESEIAENRVNTNAQRLETEKEVLGPIFSEIALKVENGEPIDAVAVTDQLRIASKVLGEEEYKAFNTVIDANQDGVLGADELSMAAAIYAVEQDDGANPQQTEFIGDDGAAHVGSFDPDTQKYVDASGRVHENATPIAPQATQGDLSGVSASGANRNTIEFMDNTIGAVSAVQMGTELLATSVTNPESLGVPGGMMRFGTNLVSGAKAIADWAGYEPLPADDTEVQEMGYGGFDYSSIDTEKLGVSGAEAEKFRAGVYGIAFAAAVAEQGTRPTDKDIQQFIDQIGGRASSPRSFRRAIVQFMRRQDNRLKSIAEVKEIPERERAAALNTWTPAFDKFMEAYAEGENFGIQEDPDGGRWINMTPTQRDDGWEKYR